MLLFVVELIGEFGVITARLRPRGRSSRRSSKQADLGVLTTDVGDRTTGHEEDLRVKCGAI